VRYIFINRFFYPDHSATSQLLTDLAVALAKSGEMVTVICSRQSYDDPQVELTARERHQGVEIVRLWTTRFGRSNLAGRAVDYLTFYLSAAWRLLILTAENDVVVAKTDPPMLSVLAGPIARLRGAKLVNWLQDLFPEVAMAVGPGKDGVMGPVYRFMKVLRDRSLRAADMNVVLGDRMAERVLALGVAPKKISLISNWADARVLRPVLHEENDLRRAWRLNGKFVVGYSGNLGRAHEYETLIDAIARLEDQPPSGPPVVWLFIGGGALYEEFALQTARRHLTSVVFKPYQSRELLSQSLSAADVHLVSLRPELEGLIVPSKFHGITAVKRPTVFIGDTDGEIARLLRLYDCGVTVAPGSGAALARAVHDLAEGPERRTRLGKNARAAFEAAFEQSIAVKHWHQLLTSIASGT
jgi:glycosyltransferase involved in cell wall biosynthesis